MEFLFPPELGQAPVLEWVKSEETRHHGHYQDGTVQAAITWTPKQNGLVDLEGFGEYNSIESRKLGTIADGIEREQRESERTGTGNAGAVAVKLKSSRACCFVLRMVTLMRYYSRSTLVSPLANELDNAANTVKVCRPDGRPSPFSIRREAEDFRFVHNDNTPRPFPGNVFPEPRFRENRRLKRMTGRGQKTGGRSFMALRVKRNSRVQNKRFDPSRLSKQLVYEKKKKEVNTLVQHTFLVGFFYISSCQIRDAVGGHWVEQNGSDSVGL
ncbi:hypothetical protein F5887DRAFT_918280 [Amanita rubescens]|nr:hypothetical protein F5887DRAFT_918280 [Amanita rubescens]